MKTFEQTNKRIGDIRRVAPLIAALAVIALVGPARQVSADAKAGAVAVKMDSVDQLKRLGWKMPPPPYPLQAWMGKEQGLIYIVIKTDATGHVAKVTIPENPPSVPSKALRGNTLAYVKRYWSGPPNATAKTAADYRLR